jgi:hypothetical protein
LNAQLSNQSYAGLCRAADGVRIKIAQGAALTPPVLRRSKQSYVCEYSDDSGSMQFRHHSSPQRALRLAQRIAR